MSTLIICTTRYIDLENRHGNFLFSHDRLERTPIPQPCLMRFFSEDKLRSIVMEAKGNYGQLMKRLLAEYDITERQFLAALHDKMEGEKDLERYNVIREEKSLTLMSEDEVKDIINSIPRNYQDPRFQIYKIDREHIYCCRPLEEQDLRKSAAFHRALLKDVIKHLGIRQFMQFQHIKFIAHSRELISEAAARIVGRRNAFQGLSFSQVAFEFIPCPDYVVDEEDDALKPNSVYLEWIAYTHEGDGNSISGLLWNYAKRLGRLMDFDWSMTKLIKKYIDERSGLKYPKSDIRDAANDELKQLLGQFAFDFFDLDGSGHVRQEIDANFANIKTIFEKYQNSYSKRKVNCLFVKFGHLCERRILDRIVDHFYKVHDEIGREPYEEIPRPLLTIGYYHIMKPVKEDRNPHFLDERFRFLDSSVWYRYVPYQNQYKFEHFLSMVLKTFGWAFENDLYKKNVCLEFLDFNNRLFKQSYLASFKDGHSSQVTPYCFHSETVMEQNAVGYLSTLTAKDGQPSNLHWSMLLVDDYAQKPLKDYRPPFKSEKVIEEKTKGALIRELILKSDFLSIHSHLPATKILIDGGYVQIEELKVARELLNNGEEIFDIILLDYLFSITESGKIEYATEFLLEIDQNKFSKGLGPFQKYWIFPVSVFPTALFSDLQNRGIQHIEKNWHLAKGADPINTPHLFRHNLYEFMCLQFEKIAFTVEDVLLFIKENPILVRHSLKDWARQTYRLFAGRYAGIYGILENTAFSLSASRFLNDVGDNNVLNAKDLIETLMSLFFRLGFTSGGDSIRAAREDFRVIQKYYSDTIRGNDDQLENMMLVFETKLNEAQSEHHFRRGADLLRRLDKIHAHITRNEVPTAINLLYDVLNILKRLDFPMDNFMLDLRTIETNYNRIRSLRRTGQITFAEYEPLINQIVANIIHLTNDIKRELRKFRSK